MDKKSSIKKHGIVSAGQGPLLKHLNGKRLTQSQAIKAKCYDCMGYFADGRADCCMPDCPLHPFMVYNPSRVASKAIKE
jgi:hypothetical protein